MYVFFMGTAVYRQKPEHTQNAMPTCEQLPLVPEMSLNYLSNTWSRFIQAKPGISQEGLRAQQFHLRYQ